MSARPPSSSSSELLGGPLVPDAARAAVSDDAWLQALLDFEAALAVAEAEAGVIPRDAAAAIGSCCEAGRFDAAALGVAGRASGNPVPPLVRALSDEVSGDAARYVHWGATSQDAIDTAAMLVASRALDRILPSLDGVASACGALAERHARTPMAGRTLLQQALPISFGLKAAGWLVGVVEARRRLAELRRTRLAVELGGAAGTLAALGDRGLAVLARLAAELGLAEPVLPWHTSRGRVAELGAGLAVAAGATEKVALDLALMAQTEVGEAAEAGGDGRGGSSTLPHKRNPVGAVLAGACARRVRGEVGVLLAALPQEHERAIGAWHSEWGALSEALAHAAAGAEHLAEALTGLELDPERMRANLGIAGGVLLAERVTLAAAERIGRPEAHAAVESASGRAAAEGVPFRDALLEEPQLAEAITADDLDELLDPEGYLGSAEAFVERALGLLRSEVGR